MAGVSVRCYPGLAVADPVSVPVLVVGQPAHLATVPWDVVRAKLEPRVTKEVGSAGLELN
jgi:hypothetical protein